MQIRDILETIIKFQYPDDRVIVQECMLRDILEINDSQVSIS